MEPLMMACNGRNMSNISSARNKFVPDGLELNWFSWYDGLEQKTNFKARNKYSTLHLWTGRSTTLGLNVIQPDLIFLNNLSKINI
jgi:hypothetical protein